MSPAQAQTQGGTLNLIVQPEPPMLVSAMNSQAPTQFVAGKIYEGLLTYTFDLKPQPGLAKSWEASPDGLHYTFHLQQGVKWHDGEPFTADDVVFSLTQMLPKVHARTKALINEFFDKVEKVDDYTVTITLKKPFPAVMQMFESGSAPMMPKHIYGGVTDYFSAPANQKPIGTGPFMFDEWKRGQYIKLKRNPNYWKPGKPYLDGIIFNVIPDAASRAVAFERGSVDALRGGDIDNVDVKRLKDLPGVQYTTKGWELFSPQAYLIFNLRKPPFDNVKVRHAIMMAMNRKLVISNIFFGMGQLSNGPFTSTEMFYDKSLPGIPFDMKKARELIKESGIKPGDYTIRQLAFPYGSTWERMDEYTKQALEQLGFKVSTESTDAGGWASRTANWDFDISTTYNYQYGDPALGIQRVYTAANIVKGSSPFGNVEGYNNPELDKQWIAAAAELDPAKRQAMYSAIQKTLLNDVPLGFLIDMEFPTLYRGKVHNLVTTATGLNESFDNVYIDK